MKGSFKALKNALNRKGNTPGRGTGALGNGTGRFLNLGCGNHFHPGWVNVDFAPADKSVLRHDLCKPLPFGDESFAVVYHSHVLEHLPKERALPFLTECRRVLQPAGIIRVVVPDLETLAALYLEKLRGALAGDQESRRHYEWSVIELLDQMVRQHADGGEMFKYLCREPIPSLDFVIQRLGHEVASKLEQIRIYVKSGLTPQKIDERRATFGAKEVGGFRTSGEAHLWMYDRYSLARLLEEAGFTEPQVMEARVSQIADFGTYRLDVLPNGEVRKPDSLFMEAKRN